MKMKITVSPIRGLGIFVEFPLPKCDPKKFSILVVFVQWETFLDRIFEFNSPVETILWIAFPVEGLYSARKEPHPVVLRD